METEVIAEYDLAFSGVLAVADEERLMQALNRHHTGAPTTPFDDPIPAELREAHYRLRRGLSGALRMELLPDGTSRVKLPTTQPEPP